MIILSLFDGMSCGRIALERAGIPVTSYYAAEIDEFAIKVAKTNYPDTIHVGDIEKWKEWDMVWENIDMLIGGSPCQGFSFSGKRLNFEDPRSKLFFVYNDIRKHINECRKRVGKDEVKFLLENVKMNQDSMSVITEFLGVKPLEVNSYLVSAQNRKRNYWCNWEISQPEDKGILLKDIIQEAVDEKYFYGEKSIQYMERGNEKWQQAGKRRADRYTQTINTPKAFCLTANFYKGVPYNYYFDGARYRKLTPRECELLQTVTPGYTSCVSDSQAYKMLGNGWTVDVIVHFFKEMMSGKALNKTENQLEMFG
jgi:DNA (cytosine-5)-methyltransferase 3A